MSRQEDNARWHKTGLAHKFFQIDGLVWLKASAPMRKAIEEDPTLVVRMDEQAIGEDGLQTVWTYLAGRRDTDGKILPLADGEDDCGFNLITPCPPAC